VETLSLRPLRRDAIPGRYATPANEALQRTIRLPRFARAAARR
jgi:hypothetical protein